MGNLHVWIAERNWRAWVAWAGVLCGLVLLLGGLLAASDRNEDVIGYAKQECAYLADTAEYGAVDPRLNFYQECIDDSLNQKFLNPGHNWFVFGGVVIGLSAFFYWRYRPGRGIVKA